MTALKGYLMTGILRRRFFFVGLDFAVIFGVEGAMLGVKLLGHHDENVADFFSPGINGVVAAIRIDHALGKGTGVDQVGERGGEVVVLLVELALGADYDSACRRGSGL